MKSGPSLQVGGPLASHLTDTIGPDIPNVSKPHPGFNVRLLDANGTEVQGLSRDASSGPGTETTHWRWLITAPGRYRLIVSFEGASQFKREIKVPSQR